MLTRGITYLRLGMLDLFRLWSATQHHIIIVAGICLPILMLLGLKRGHVAELRAALLTSPTGRQVIFGSSQHGELLTRDGLQRLQQELPGVETIIPDTFRVVKVKSGRESSEATLFATGSVDPLLSHLGAELPTPGDRTIILGESLAGKLRVKVGDTVQVVVTRIDAGREETATVDLTVRSIVDTGEPGSMTAHVEVGLLDRFSTWVQGFRVADLGWSAGGSPARPGFKSYIAFCPKTRPFTPRDLRDLDLNYKVIDITDRPPPELAQLLRPERRSELRIYHLISNNPRQPLEAPFRTDVYDTGVTDADEAILPWNEVLTLPGPEGQSIKLVGLTFRQRWLRPYFRDEALLSDVGEDPYQVRVIESPKEAKGDSLTLKLDAKNPLVLKQIEGKVSPTKEQEALAVVPASLLAWITAYRADEIDYDPTRKLFKQKASEQQYTRARSYAFTIDEVPDLVEALWQRNFSVTAETARITEIHRQDASLQLLVFVVGAGVFLFGILTVISVLHDSTDRKRGAIGILRVMGTSRKGIFLLIFFRAAVIGLFASILCAGLGWLLSLGLAWSPPSTITWLQGKPIVAVQLYPRDYLIILCGSLLCCTLGALWPAWRASRLDPFDAIVEGRFR